MFSADESHRSKPIDSQEKRRQSAAVGHSRRDFLSAIAAFGVSRTVSLGSLLRAASTKSATSKSQPPKSFRVWLISDAHVGSDMKHGRESLSTALRQSESATGFDWDIALNLGDMSGAQETPKDEEGEEIVRQFGALKQHRREQIYDLCGNHDRSGLDEAQAWWWRKWLDPTGEHTQFSRVDSTRRPFPIDGTWERYSFRAGNILFLVMSDINEPTQKVGRGTLGGNPGGVVSGDTFRWWKRMIEENPSSIIISAHHYVLKNTTVASGEWEGMDRNENGGWKPRYHGYFPQGTPQGASYLYWVDSKPDSGAFEGVLAAKQQSIDLWLGAHTHTVPDDTYGGKSHIERRWGTTFINAAGLTLFHSVPGTAGPRSWLLTFTDGSSEVTAQCYLHGNEYAPQGWYPKVNRVIPLSKPFKLPAARSSDGLTGESAPAKGSFSSPI
jgi:hypothetical protein